MNEYSIAFSTLALSGKIPAGDPLWPKFTASFVNETLPTIDIANRIYAGNAFTTWHDNHWRHASNYMQGQHIGLDFDTEDERSSIAYLAKEKFVGMVEKADVEKAGNQKATAFVKKEGHYSIYRNAYLKDIWNELKDANYDVPVVDATGRLRGVLGYDDILKALAD